MVVLVSAYYQPTLKSKQWVKYAKLGEQSGELHGLADLSSGDPDDAHSTNRTQRPSLNHINILTVTAISCVLVL